tara:strand:+ start:361 stop:1248 length:888 start_codon:yes stop_codon:yes gene_type:complete
MPLVKDAQGNWTWQYTATSGGGPPGQPSSYDFEALADRPSTTGLPGESIADEYERLAAAATLAGKDTGYKSLAELQAAVLAEKNLVAGAGGAYYGGKGDDDDDDDGGGAAPPYVPPPPVAPQAVTGAPMFDVAGGYELDKLSLARDVALQDAQNQIAQMGARILELESSLRGPENAIQYSNLRYGLQDFAGGYPAFLNRLGGLAYSGSQRPDPFKGIVNLNNLPSEAVGYPGIIRAFDPNSIDIRSLRNLPEYDMKLYQNFVESAGGDFNDLLGAVGRYLPGSSSIGGAFAGAVA